MSNPTLISSNTQRHCPLRGLYRTNTLVELSARIIGSSSRLRGLTFVSETVGVSVVLSPGDFISVGQALDMSLPTREAGIIVRTENNSTIDTSGFTNPYIYGFAPNTNEATAVQFLVTEAAPPPTTEYAPIIFKSGGVWYSNRAIGNDSLSNSGVLASGQSTVPANGATVLITHSLGLASYKVFLQPINQSVGSRGVGGITGDQVAGVIYPLNQLINTFEVANTGGRSCDFYWMVIS